MKESPDPQDQHDAGFEESFVEIYDSLRRLAHRRLGENSSEGMLQPTALVHDVFLKLRTTNNLKDASTTKQFAYAAKTMRHLLVSHYRKSSSLKRGGHLQRIEFDENQLISMRNGHEVLAMDDALRRLKEIDEQRAKIVEMRCFGGMTNKEIALALGVSESTVKNKWAATRAWLRKEFSEGN